MKTLLTFILSLFTLSASAATTNYLATASRTNDNFFLSDTNVVIVGNGIWTWTTTLGYFRSNIMRLGGVTGPLNVNGLTNLAQIIQTTELDVQNILPKTTTLSIYSGSSSGILYDFANRIAVDFKNHKLYDAAQNVIVDFSDTNNVTLSAPITALKFTGDGSGLSNVTAVAVSGTGATIGSFKDSAAFQFGYIDGGTNGGLVLTNASGSRVVLRTNGTVYASEGGSFGTNSTAGALNVQGAIYANNIGSNSAAVVAILGVTGGGKVEHYAIPSAGGTVPNGLVTNAANATISNTNNTFGSVVLSPDGRIYQYTTNGGNIDIWRSTPTNGFMEVAVCTNANNGNTTFSNVYKVDHKGNATFGGGITNNNGGGSLAGGRFTVSPSGGVLTTTGDGDFGGALYAGSSLGVRVPSDGKFYFNVGGSPSLTSQSTNIVIGNSVGVSSAITLSTWGIELGTGSARGVLTNILYASATLDFPSTAAGGVSDLQITVAGASDGDVVTLGVPSAQLTTINGDYFGWASNGVVYVRFANNNLVSAQDPASGTFKIKVEKFK